MDCRNVKPRLNRYVDGELPPGDRSRIEQHLHACAACREALERLRAAETALVQLPAPPGVPEGFAERVMARARGHAAGRRHQFREFRRAFHWWQSSSVHMQAAAAAFVIVGIAAGIFMARDTWQPAPSPPVVSVQSAEAEVLATYNLDYLSDAPNGSLAQVYVTLVSAPNGGRN